LLIRIPVIGASSITTWLLVTTAIMHARDVMGVLLLLLVATEATRKYMTIQDLSRMQQEAAELTSMFEINQAARRLLTPPAAIARTRVQETIVRQETTVRRPSLCQSPGMDCLPGEEVRCEFGRHEGCDCEYIRSCFPRASQCTFFNATHITTCGF
jgi:hypothetical protein